ncbi:hypothetical protein P389DRAFT_169851 [Cystobasidium minutum MCA 4210]|uniref:uncharacterized protein n=1 Tax=Cystobasidium minutum MCA 4210 TaxID=1397322 RepID=UPI0034CE5183|eukprot:jgi/Rhomi1/169851/fgenesh1_kg.3_\
MSAGQQHQLQGHDGIAVLEGELQGLLESLLELGVCTSEVHPSAVEAAPNGEVHNDQHHQENGIPSSTANSAWSGYKHAGGLVGRKVQDSIQAMQSVFNAHINLPQTRELLIPHEVIDYVDQGRNPDIYTKELLDRVSGENMYTNGILDAVSSYQEILAFEMKAAFPMLTDVIDELGIKQSANMQT